MQVLHYKKLAKESEAQMEQVSGNITLSIFVVIPVVLSTLQHESLLGDRLASLDTIFVYVCCDTHGGALDPKLCVTC